VRLLASLHFDFTSLTIHIGPLNITLHSTVLTYTHVTAVGLSKICPQGHWCAGSASIHTPDPILWIVVSRVENDKLLDADCLWTTLPADITAFCWQDSPHGLRQRPAADGWTESQSHGLKESWRLAGQRYRFRSQKIATGL
jgi:hypothetical protein